MPASSSRRKNLIGVKPDAKANAGLWLDKFITGQDENIEPKPKQSLINEVTAIEIPNIYKEFFDRWQDSLYEIGAKFKSLEIDGRMVVGLGAESVLETSIALHRTYGVPYISGSALKGLAASYAHKHLGNDWKKETGNAHKFVFGSQDSAGFINFHDALLMPKIKNALHADIMTVHHGEYYGDKNVPPADWDNPVPIPFLSATGKYLVAISGIEGAEDWIEFVWLILEKALQEEGIGAKTSSGYGRAKMDELHDSEKTAKMRESELARVEAEHEKHLLKTQEAKKQARIDAEHHQAKIAAQIEAKKQAEIEQQQKNNEKLINDTFEQIKAVNATTKKPEDLFDNLSSLIHKVKDEERKRLHYISAYFELERLTNEGVKIVTSNKSGKPYDWFITLKKKSGAK